MGNLQAQIRRYMRERDDERAQKEEALARIDVLEKTLSERAKALDFVLTFLRSAPCGDPTRQPLCSEAGLSGAHHYDVCKASRERCTCWIGKVIEDANSMVDEAEGDRIVEPADMPEGRG